MKILCENIDLYKIINKIPFSKLSPDDIKAKPEILMAICKAIIYDKYQEYYDWENNKLVYGVMWENIQTKTSLHISRNDSILFNDLYLFYLFLSIPSFHPAVIREILAVPLISYQVIFQEKEKGIKPVAIRVNEEVRGRLYGNSEYIVYNMNLNLINLNNVQFDIDEYDGDYDSELGVDRKFLSHITVFEEFLNNEKPLVFWDFIYKGKQNTNLDIDLLIQYTHLTEEEFLKYAKEQGYPVSSKTLRNYRSKKYQSIFPEPKLIKDRKSGIVKKYYDKSWIEYLKRIEELKKILREKKENIDVTKLRDFDKKLGGNTFDDISIRNT